MKLKSTRLTYEFKHEAGYYFTVVAEKGLEGGWDARVDMRTGGFISPEAAVSHLAHAAEAFLEMAKDAKP